MVSVAGCRHSKAGLNSPGGGKHKNVGTDLTCNRSFIIFPFPPPDSGGAIKQSRGRTGSCKRHPAPPLEKAPCCVEL